MKYLGVKPKMVIEKLKNNVKIKAEEKIYSLSNVKETEEFSQLEGIYKRRNCSNKKRRTFSSIKREGEHF